MKMYSRISQYRTRSCWKMPILLNFGKKSWLWWYFAVNVPTWRSQSPHGGIKGIRIFDSGFWLLTSGSWAATNSFYIRIAEFLQSSIINHQLQKCHVFLHRRNTAKNHNPGWPTQDVPFLRSLPGPPKKDGSLLFRLFHPPHSSQKRHPFFRVPKM